MTSRERIEAALTHREPDRTPIFEYVLLSPVADQLIGRPYAADPDNWDSLVTEKGWTQAVRQMSVDILDVAQLLGHDMLYVLPNLPPQETVQEPKAEEPPPSSDPVENVKRRNAFYEQRPFIIPEERFLVYVYLKEEMNARGIDLPILAPAYEHGVWTDVDLMQTMLLEPEVARAHFAFATLRALAFTEQYFAYGIDQIGVGGDFSGSMPLISPQSYKAFIVPEIRKLTERIHESGAWAVNASDGNLWPVIDDFLIGCDVDGYIEIDMQAGMDLRRLKQLYGERITFYGNLDCGTVLSFATPEVIRRHTIECLEAGMGNGGHILCASNAITSSVPLQNYLAIVHAYRDFFHLTPLHLSE